MEYTVKLNKCPNVLVLTSKPDRRGPADPVMSGKLWRLPGKYTILPCVDDYKKTIKVFEKVIKTARECTIYLPYWTEIDESGIKGAFSQSPFIS